MHRIVVIRAMDCYAPTCNDMIHFRGREHEGKALKEFTIIQYLQYLPDLNLKKKKLFKLEGCLKI